MTPVQEAKVIALCERIGMPWERSDGQSAFWHPWDGRALNLRHTRSNGSSDYVHEVAHWLVARKAKRHLPDFGLEDNDLFKVDLEELLASMLGILIELHLGLDWRFTWDFHRWGGQGWDDVRPTIRALQQRGLLKGLVPTCLLRRRS